MLWIVATGLTLAGLMWEYKLVEIWELQKKGNPNNTLNMWDPCYKDPKTTYLIFSNSRYRPAGVGFPNPVIWGSILGVGFVRVFGGGCRVFVVHSIGGAKISWSSERKASTRKRWISIVM